ncbi:MAG: hypothetical protein Tsb0010_15610 [Parvularculaceae bacterium]
MDKREALDAVADWIAARGEAVRRAPDHGAEMTRLPEADDPDEIAADAAAAEIPLTGRAFMIEYRSGPNAEWRRRVLVRGVSTASDGRRRLHAYCFERGAPRAFWAERIERMVCVATNEVIDNPALALREDAHEATAEDRRAERALLKHVGDGLRLLMFVARCDDEFHPEERRVIHNYVKARARAAGLEPDEAFIDQYLSIQYPDRETALAAWRRVLAAGDEAHAALLIDSIESLIGADGVIAAQEASFISLIKRLKTLLDPAYAGRGSDAF